MDYLASDKYGVRALVDLCQRKGVTKVVISPGSRSAPLTISFANNPNFECLTIVDERSAAYFALGLARELREPVVLVCTSGTAALNYAPAIAKAYYQHVPLIVITADRPLEWIDQGDGQTINQQGIYNNFTRFQCTLPPEGLNESNQWHLTRLINEALWKCTATVPGPVHINVPLNEPLYETTTTRENSSRQIEFSTATPVLNSDAIAVLVNEIERYDKVMVVVGAMHYNDELNTLLEALSNKGVVIITETLSNSASESFIQNTDRVVSTIAVSDKQLFAPDLLITFDIPVLSRMIKELLRDHPPRLHWHFSNDSNITDTYKALTRKISGSTPEILEQVTSQMKPRDTGFIAKWRHKADHALKQHFDYLENLPWCDLKLFDVLSRAELPPSQIHLGNSTPVRYAELFNWPANHQWYSNRGTSGIDGSVSTSAGAAHASKKPVLLIVGDLSLFYDSNGLWHKYLPADFRIIVINNGGGAIFRYISGPASTSILEEYFEVKHGYNCEGIAKTFGLEYLKCSDERGFKSTLTHFFAPASKPILLEIFTPGEENGILLKNYFKFLKTIP